MPPTYSLNGAHVAIVFNLDNKVTPGAKLCEQVLLDGVPGPKYDGLDDLQFSPDGNHLVYTGSRGTNGEYYLVIDQQERAIAEPIAMRNELLQTRYLFFDAPNRFHYFALQDRLIKRVEVTIPPNGTGAKNVNPVLLQWVDEASGTALFTNNDIVYFDWNQQLFQLTDGANQSLQSLPQLQHRYFLLKDKEGVIYRGTLYSAMSSIGFDGPAIELFGLHEPGGINPPTYKIQAWYGGAVPRGKEQRFNPRLLNALKAAGILILPVGASK